VLYINYFTSARLEEDKIVKSLPFLLKVNTLRERTENRRDLIAGCFSTSSYKLGEEKHKKHMIV
jgi:hypothetical protein